ncbi:MULTISPECIES: phage Gp37/Gp68 family protein [unclassified Mesorhizobium]|uniref:DUF5131 family protein n=1 Tax=unclassified Mesorhizobium TaxID=325217 RepID=UPI00112D8793|nr:MULTISPECIES: phage Gp37/Gp68 family protein [unclassified Mesorhizobium]MCA0025512.1 phage Gp37/Gp68 family protein [Mesorhizobium sp. B263B1A]TPJ97106.1 phage Gp37/Gp68 family protein [Mesorhizobium sp. B2-5-12]TPK27228.1 phage Gp37/Gp68 family protein [Mesorhizobium sp. B2-5-6]
MADKSAIEWTDATWTPIRARYWEIQKDGSGKERIGWHCEHASEGCRFCYAEGFNRRLGTGLDFKPGELFREEKRGYKNGEVKLFLDEEMLTAPLRWKKPRMIFVCSMTDLFADFVPDEWIDRMFAVMARSRHHTFQVLTKRAARMRAYLARFKPDGQGWITPNGEDGYQSRAPLDPKRWPLPNVWLGVSAERQQEADERIPELLATPAAIRFVSAEPLLGPIDFYETSAAMPVEGHSWKNGPILQGVDWIIAGGESGPSARPMHPAWARSIRDQCHAAGVSFFFKQWGEWAPQIGAVDGWMIDDDPEISRFDHREWENERWSEPFRPMWCDWQDGNYDEEQCVSRIGKKRAGRLLDGVEHNAMPGPREVPAL